MAEISDQKNITRQGVRDNIKRTENALLELEEKLGMLKLLKSISDELSKITSENSENSEEIKNQIKSLKEKIDNLNF